MKKIYQLLSVFTLVLLLTTITSAVTRNTIVAGSQSAQVFSGNGAYVTFDITITRGASDSTLNLPLTVTNLPTNVTYSFVTDTYAYPVVFGPEDTVQHATLKLLVPSTISVGSYQISVNGEGFTSGTVNLVVSPIITPPPCPSTTPGCPGYIDTPPPSKTAQTITFPAIDSPQIVLAHVKLTASSDSGLSISYSASGTCSIDESNSLQLDFNSVGECDIKASQPGNLNYLAATDVSQKINVVAPEKKSQTINFTQITSPQTINSNVTLVATSTSLLSVTFSASGTCAIDATISTQLDFNSIGNCTVTASQSGNDTYSAATDVVQNISVEDNDGVSNSIEDAGPNNGDGNGDGIKDSQQVNVVSAPDYNLEDSPYVTLEVDGDVGTTNISNFQTDSTKGLKITNGSSAPVGGFSFTASGGFEGSITVKIILDKVYDTTNWVLKKSDDGGNLTTGPEATFTNVTIGSTTRTQISYTIRDNGDFDQNSTSGIISDPVFPIIPPASTPVPDIPATAGDWASPKPVIPTSTTAIASTTGTTTPIIMPQVLGASTTCGVYMNLNGDYLSVGHKNKSDQVILLKKFLNKNLGINLEINDVYDLNTEDAVKKFQTKYKDQILGPWGIGEPTGIVYLTTVEYINYLECPALGFNLSRIKLIPIDKKDKFVVY